MRSNSVALVALVSTVLSPSDVHAQSFFEKLFGLSPPPAAVAPPAYSRPAPAVQARSLAPVVIHSRADRSPPEQADADGLRRRTTGRFRAVCVRLCDGYYWPMNDRATTQTLYETADRCKASCGAEAKLFYTENDDIEPGAMTDLAGKRYDALRTAFVYRDKLIAGCSCKPAPWSAAEQSRHQGYALAAARAVEQARVAAAAEAARKEAEAARAIAVASPKPAGTELGAAPIAGPEALPEPVQTATVTRSDQAAEATAGQATVAADAEASRFDPTSSLEPTATPRIETVGRVRARTIRVSERSERAMGPRPRAARGPAEMRPQKVAAGGGGFGLFGGGKPKYVWPGDR